MLLRRVTASTGNGPSGWRSFVFQFLGISIAVAGSAYLFILLIDPFGVVPFSLPIERPVMGHIERWMYPQIIRSRRFNSVVLGTSTSRLLDPELLDRLFGGRFVNLGMDQAKAWEQKNVLDLFLRAAGPPKVLIVGLDPVWCDQAADRTRVTNRGFPEWLYDDSPWNDYFHLLNTGTLEIAGRILGYALGLKQATIRGDGYEVFVPPEAEYDAVRARQNIGQRPPPPAAPAPALSPAERSQLSFPALPWLDDLLARIPPSSLKILAFMPAHVATQPVPGTRAAYIENECKDRVVAIARMRGAMVIDWRINSPLTRNDLNYWDGVHYRVPVATRIAEELAAATLGNSSGLDGSYVVLVR